MRRLNKKQLAPFVHLNFFASNEWHVQPWPRYFTINLFYHHVTNRPSFQFNLPKEFQQICHGLEACDEDWEKRHDGLKKIQELIKKGAGDNANFYPLFEKQIQKLLLHQVRSFNIFKYKNARRVFRSSSNAPTLFS